MRVQHVRCQSSSDSARSPRSRRDQLKLLEIQSSPRGESSDSITLTKSFIEACKSDKNSIVVDMLNVWNESLPEFDYEAIGAKYKAVKHETMTGAEPQRMGAYSIVDPTLSERRSHRLRNSNVTVYRRVHWLFAPLPLSRKRKEKTRHRYVGSSDSYALKLPFATSFAITAVRLVGPLMCSVPGTPK